MVATVSLQEAGDRTWDMIVVGAGPAGAIAARQLAQLGRRVLLVDKRQFPRDKVCGCCVGPQAQLVLREVGLEELLIRLGAQRYGAFRLYSRGRSAILELPDGFAVTRSAFDLALIESAVEQGAHFLPGTLATAGEFHDDARVVGLRNSMEECAATSRVVIAADGLGGKLLARNPETRYETWRHSRMGAGTVMADGADAFAAGTIHMAVSKGGYVGIVRAEQQQLAIAAAMDAQFVRHHGDVSSAVESILSDNKLVPLKGFHQAHWRGTGRLTCRPSCSSSPGLFTIGDAAGYIEPFTGEGMGWAMRSAVLVAPFAEEALRGWSEELARRWLASHRHALRNRQRSCFRLARALRYPWLVHNAIRALSRFPILARPIVRQLQAPAEKVYT